MRSFWGMMRLCALFGRSFNPCLLRLQFRQSAGSDLGSELLTRVYAWNAERGDWPYFVPHARDYEGFKKKSFKGANLFGFWVV